MPDQSDPAKQPNQMDKTRKLDFATLTLKDALDLATLIEEEAKDRYEEFADQMEKHHNPEAARFFRFMLSNETKHEDRLSARRKELFGDSPRLVRREMIFDIEAPEYDEVRASMSVRMALDASLRAETKAAEFFDAAIERVQLADVKAIFAELRDEEIEHQQLVKKEIAKLPTDYELPIDDEDEDFVAL